MADNAPHDSSDMIKSLNESNSEGEQNSKPNGPKAVLYVLYRPDGNINEVAQIKDGVLQAKDLLAKIGITDENITVTDVTRNSDEIGEVLAELGDYRNPPLVKINEETIGDVPALTRYVDVRLKEPMRPRTPTLDFSASPFNTSPSGLSEPVPEDLDIIQQHLKNNGIASEEVANRISSLHEEIMSENDPVYAHDKLPEIHHPASILPGSGWRDESMAFAHSDILSPTPIKQPVTLVGEFPVGFEKNDKIDDVPSRVDTTSPVPPQHSVEQKKSMFDVAMDGIEGAKYGFIDWWYPKKPSQLQEKPKENPKAKKISNNEKGLQPLPVAKMVPGPDVVDFAVLRKNWYGRKQTRILRFDSIGVKRIAPEDMTIRASYSYSDIRQLGVKGKDEFSFIFKDAKDEYVAENVTRRDEIFSCITDFVSKQNKTIPHISF